MSETKTAEAVAEKPATAKAEKFEDIGTIVDRFLMELQTHPDSALLGFAKGGAIPPGALIPGVTSAGQQLVSLRFVMRKPLK